jgi:hypothetical protein
MAAEGPAEALAMAAEEPAEGPTEVAAEVSAELPQFGAAADAEVAATQADIMDCDITKPIQLPDSDDDRPLSTFAAFGAEDDAVTHGYSDHEGSSEEHDAAEQARDKSGSEASSAARRSRSLPLVQATLDDMERTPICTKCAYPITEILRAKLYGKQSGAPTFICRCCNNLMTMVTKHMDLKQLEISGLSFHSLQQTSAGTEFFKQAREAADANGGLRWNQVRELLTSALTERRKEVFKITYTTRERPLSVWVNEGFSAEELLKNGTQVKHPVFSDVYSAPLKDSSREDVMHP